MATDFISRKDAKDKHCEICEHLNICYQYDGDDCRTYTGRTCIERQCFNAIPAADVVEVVRCKDCRYFHNGYDEKCCINHKGVVVTDENGFCHHAERRADDG